MKYSFLLPYCKRDSFESSIISFLYHYSDRNDYELVIVEDLASSEDQGHHDKLLDIIKRYESKINMVYCLDNFRSYNSAKKYNIGFKKSSGDFIVLSNPETFHTVNILAGFDQEFSNNPLAYIVCSCLAVDFPKQVIDKYEDHSQSRIIQWYQHSNFNNRMLHFCTALSRENYVRTGGFDEKYCAGIAYEDDCFLKRVQINGIPIAIRDEFITLHIEHSRQYLHDNQDLYRRNAQLYTMQLATHDFFEKFI
jgi:hypothetical protein